MKRILLSTAAVALLFTTACTTTTEETNVNATDTVNMLPPADNTGPGIEGANPEMVDPNGAGTTGGATGGSTDGSMSPAGNTGNTSNTSNTGSSGSSTSGSNSAKTNTAGSKRGSQDVVVPAAPPKDDIKSTYKRAAPGDTVDSRTNMGSSR